MTDLEFLLTVIAILLMGILLFILTGFIHVKKGFAAIIEKTGRYCGTYQAGLYYFVPLLMRRVGMYKLGECHRFVELDRQKGYFVDYEIMDIKLFHYSGHDIEALVRLARNESPDDLAVSLKTRCPTIGARFISITENKNRG